MKNKNAYARYRLIDARLNLKQQAPPTLQDLVEYVGEHLDMTISVSSIQKDIYAMRYDSGLGFDAPIAYDRSTRAYHYTEVDYSITNIPLSLEDLKGLEFATGLLEQYKDIPAIKVFSDAISKISSSVKQSIQKESSSFFIPDRPNAYMGIEHIPFIADAIREKRECILKYQPFNRDMKKHSIHPYFIKEYNGRLYLIAKDIHPTKDPKFLTFSFDRVQDIIVMNTNFEEEELDEKKFFDATIGISRSDSGPERVVLSFVPAQAQYIISQPIHHSQEVIKHTKHSFQIAIEVVVNYELLERIKGYGNQVKVLKPKHMAKEIQETAQKVLDLYK